MLSVHRRHNHSDVGGLGGHLAGDGLQAEETR